MRGIIKQKKSVMNQVIAAFVLILVISVLSAMTFLFVISLKTNVQSNAPRTTVTITNETGAFVNSTGYRVSNATVFGFASISVTEILNATGGEVVNSPNYTVESNGYIYNATNDNWNSAVISYTYNYIDPDDAIAYNAVNRTENAGFQVTSYLTLLFLALIFGAVLIVVLRVILPYINLGKQMNTGGF